MAFKGELFVEGPDGALEGPRENGSSLVFEFNHEVYLPYELETNRVQGSRRITAYTLVKDIDKITPILYQYCCEGTKLPKVTGSKPTSSWPLSVSTTGRLIRLGNSTISATALLCVWMSCCSGVSLRKVVPLVFNSVFQPMARHQSTSRSRGTPAFL